MLRPLFKKTREGLRPPQRQQLSLRGQLVHTTPPPQQWRVDGVVHPSPNGNTVFWVGAGGTRPEAATTFDLSLPKK